MTRLLPVWATLLSLPLAHACAQSCNASVTSLLFGNYQPTSGASSLSTSTISVMCVAITMPMSLSYSIQIGTGTGGSFSSRSLALGGTRLNYQIYRDAAYTQVWGDGTSGTFVVNDAYLLPVVPVTRTYTAYGRIPASQNVGVGSYTDSVSVLVIY